MSAVPPAPIRHALLSVSDKTGLIELGRRLAAAGIQLLSTGGSAHTLREAGIAVQEVSTLTQFPEIMDGRVKTLHPKIHGGLLGRRGIDDAVMDEHHITPIDLLVVNLYPFESVTAKPDCTLEEAIEHIDIGGPAMLRAAAKNWRDVAVLTDASQYEAALHDIETSGMISRAHRFQLAVAAFNRVAVYDAAISHYLSGLALNPAHDTSVGQHAFPAQRNEHLIKRMDLRYGENPHQQAAFYRDPAPAAGTLATFQQLQGKDLSYNNIADADAAWECVRQFDAPACVIVKHANPCGAAIAPELLSAYDRAYATDPTSAFGGIIAFNRPLDAKTAAHILQRQFVEVLIAPAIEPDTLAVTAAKTQVRLLVIPPGAGHNTHDIKRVGGGLLVQHADNHVLTPAALKTVTRKHPSEQQLNDLFFAWHIAKYVKSNAIVYAREGRTIGIGAGQMSRVISAKIAALKAEQAELKLSGSVMASDAFFPFRDGIDTAAAAGISAVIQPGGSKRDAEVIDAADAAGMAMVFTGIRHFRH